MSARPYSPETLATRWDCSAEKVRRMVHTGELAGFRLGKLIRIPAQEVERYECLTTPSASIEGGTSSPSETKDDGFEYRLGRMTGDSRKLALIKSGNSAPRPSRNG